jgi:aspartyl-tRNA(Asn)/glutamyl-tRNA(Gln) amidotransferase subunit C
MLFVKPHFSFCTIMHRLWRNVLLYHKQVYNVKRWKRHYTSVILTSEMAKLTREDVLKLARLARLQLSDEEIDRFREEISTILEYVEILQKVDLNGLEPTNQVTGLKNVMRPDVVKDYGVTPEELLKNAPATENNHIKVKRILG